MSFSKVLSIVSLLAILIIAGCSAGKEAGVNQTSGPVVATVGGRPISLSEFERRYARTIGGVEEARNDSAAQLQEFLTRYVDFRLKVRAAEAAGLDRNPEVLREMATYRANLARPYLIERSVTEPIARELHTRMQEAVHASHILIRIPENPTPADTLAAWNKITAIADSARRGEDFGGLAVRNSDDPSSKMEGRPGYRGDLGFFTAGRMVPEFEDQAYATPVGSISPVVRSQFGYHIILVHDRKPSVPDIRVAHIYKNVRGKSAADSLAIVDSLRSIRARVLNGESFADLARQFSDHKTSAERGGELGSLSFYFSQVVPQSFRDAAFALQNPGDVSDIVWTPVGLHVIKLLDRQKLSDYDAMSGQLKEMVTRSPRFAAAEAKYARDLMKQYGYKVDQEFVNSVTADVPADSLIRWLPTGRIGYGREETAIATMGDSTFTFRRVKEYAQRAKRPQGTTAAQQLTDLTEQFLQTRVVDMEVSALAKRDAEFGDILSEFQEGLMLFRIMEDSVWSVASRDSLGLQRYWEARKANYRFPDRTRILALYSPSDSVITEAIRIFHAGGNLPDIYRGLRGDGADVHLDTTLTAAPTGTQLDRALTLKPGELSEKLTIQRRYALLLNDGLEPARPKTFTEARAEVLTEYQQQLEAAFLQRLRQQYGVTTHPEVLKQAYKSAQLVRN